MAEVVAQNGAPKPAPDAVLPPAPAGASSPGGGDAASGAASEAPKEQTLAEKRAALADAATREIQRKRARDAERAEIARAKAELEQERQQRAAMQARLEALEKDAADPLTFLEKRGVTAAQLGERIVKSGTPDGRLQELSERLQASEAEHKRLRDELQQREQRLAHERAYMTAKAQLGQAFDSQKEKTPLLQRLDDEGKTAEYMRTYYAMLGNEESAARNRIQPYTDAELIEATEARLTRELEERLEGYELAKLEAHLTKRKGSATVNATQAPSPGEPAAGKKQEAADSRNGSKTLTGALASSSAGSWKPDNFDKLSDKKQNELLIEALRKGLLK